jgi:hypothetical protein
MIKVVLEYFTANEKLDQQFAVDAILSMGAVRVGDIAWHRMSCDGEGDFEVCEHCNERLQGPR